MAEYKYDPPEIVGDVDALPMPIRPRNLSNIYDPIIIYVSERPDMWHQIDVRGRGPQAFRRGMLDRLDQISVDMRVKQRGEFVYARYVANNKKNKKTTKQIIEEAREEARAEYEQ